MIFLVPHALPECFHSPFKQYSPYFLPLKLERPLWLPCLIKYDTSETLWLLRLGCKTWYSFCLAPCSWAVQLWSPEPPWWRDYMHRTHRKKQRERERERTKSPTYSSPRMGEPSELRHWVIPVPATCLTATCRGLSKNHPAESRIIKTGIKWFLFTPLSFGVVLCGNRSSERFPKYIRMCISDHLGKWTGKILALGHLVNLCHW